MYVINRSGVRESIRYDKITDRNIELASDLDVDVTKLSQLVIQSLKDGMTTSDIDLLSSETAFYMSTYEPQYDILASRIAISNLHKSTKRSFSAIVADLYNSVNKRTGKKTKVISKTTYDFVMAHMEEIDNAICHERDYNYNYFGFKTLEKSYLLKIDNKIVERPQHMLMRVAIGIHGPCTREGYEREGDLEKALETYRYMSQGLFTHASPTLFNAGSESGQYSSCFLLMMEDELEHIYTTNLRSALISKHAGGIGIDITNVRSKGSAIHSTNGTSDGIVPMIQTFNATARYCNQCILPTVVVYCKDGIKQIKDVKIDDFVITNDGSYKKVNDIFINDKEEEIYKISVAGGFEPLLCTHEHKIMCIEDETKDSYENICKRLDKGTKEIKYLWADQLKKKYFLGFPKPTFSKDNDFWTEELCRYYGILLGDGSICRSSNSCRVQVSLNNTTKKNTMKFIEDLYSSFNLHYWKTNDNNDIHVTTSYLNKYIPNIEEIIYDENHEKCMTSEILHLPINKISKCLKGLFETDGFITDSGIFFGSTSKNLIFSVRYMLLRIGILCTVQTVNHVGQVKNINKKGIPIICKKIYYSLRVPKLKILKDLDIIHNFIETTKVSTYFEYNNTLFTRIKNIEKTYYEGKVYDLSIDTNHNYLTDSGLVHNSGKRKGSIAMYLQPWHPDIFEFVALRYNTPPDEIRARDIFLALWIPDIFMRRVEKDEMWSLICPSVVPRLTETYGEEFEQIYEEAERDGLYVKQIKARELWNAILSAQEETGMPYINYKDSINKKSNQKNIGIIRSSNLCSEIVEYTDRNSVAVCNLASIALPRFYKNGKFDFDLLREVVRTTIINLNKIIDINFYPVKEAETNNLAYRPVGLGIQGLADLFAICKTPWGSDKAKLINRIVFECIYYYALEMSYELSQIHGSYSAFEGSPASQGILQYHMWNTEPLTKESHDSFIHPVLDWDSLIERVKKGLRNSLLIACMPTASTAQILGNNESIEPFTSNIYSRNVLSGTFTIVNQHLYKDLKEKDLWTKRIVDSIISHDGSIQEIPEIPLDIKELYKTVWEIPQKVLVDYSIDRGAFIDQTQSLNIFMAHPTHAKLSSMHLYSWKNGAKTSNYYIRSKPSRNAVKFTIMETKETKETKEVKQDIKKKFVCVGEEGCLSCGA